MYSCRRIYYSYAHRFQFIYESTHVHVRRVNTSAVEEEAEEVKEVEEKKVEQELQGEREEEEEEEHLTLRCWELEKDLETLKSAQSNLQHFRG